jgi:hypothetical protein
MMITRRDLTCYSAACAVPLRNGRYRAFGVGVYDGARAESSDVIWGEWAVRSDGLLRLERDLSGNVAQWLRLATNENPAWVVNEWDEHVIESMTQNC